ncbi:tRNA (guanosine(37)-N1)-methyltransferase TrmD [Alicyclobacillus cellulosilyticus]|uniref:tRNA (guanosine(37)-N1)-methyltransferase TrmD n=1 Tax=Alicyclobacillus cellulosilyticus TaxID=1003997 RepID=UPI00166C3C30|nr:tRNA (guanosine(37)-N1)-methyltransferase TrmD [Alicyclobacillus cellulosilyticus]
MKVTIFTLFPQMFTGVLEESILKRAREGGYVDVRLVNFRDYAVDKHKTVDDYPFGGGAGMVLKPEPLFRAVEAVLAGRRPGEVPVILLTPQGRTFTQRIAEELAATPEWMLICGHYEGFDERVRQHLATDELSLGDFVMTGGEIAAMAVLDAVVRLIPGVLGNETSSAEESFANGLLEYPQYTRPAVFRGWSVPEVLLSGHHAKIAAWRHRHALFRTWRRRPDLLAAREFSAEERAWLARWQEGDWSDIDVPE